MKIFRWKAATAALLMGMMFASQSVPAYTQSSQDRRDGRDRDRFEDRRQTRDRVDERRQTRNRVEQRDRTRGQRQTNYRRPGRVVYNYDWNRPEPRYGRSYRPERYYRSGYEPMRVNRSTRIYRGHDDRYYCRRSDGTTGLIVGAALGGLLGGQLDRGQSNIASILIGAGAGGLLGREIDRGNLNCR